MSRQKEHLNKIVSNLDILESKKTLITSEVDRIVIISSLAKINETPQANIKGSQQAINELEKFQKLSKKLYAYINSMSKTARDKLEYHEKDNNFSSCLLLHDLNQIYALSENGIDALKSIPDIPKRGSPKKVQAQQVVSSLIRTYENLTGKKAQRKSSEGYEYGELFEYIKEGLAALNIDASSDAQIRQFLANK